MKKWDAFVAALLVGLGLVTIYLSKDFPKEVSSAPGPGFYPTILGILLIILAILLVLNSFLKQSSQKTNFWSKEARRVYFTFGLTVIYSILMYYVGFYLATVLFLVTTMLFMGVKKKWLVVVMTFLITLFIFIVFDYFLHTPFPTQRLF